MTIPAMPTFPRTLGAKAAGQISSGTEFVQQGFHYMATDTARPWGHSGGHIIPACRKNPAMPSGWELASVTLAAGEEVLLVLGHDADLHP